MQHSEIKTLTFLRTYAFILHFFKLLLRNSQKNTLQQNLELICGQYFHVTNV